MKIIEGSRVKIIRVSHSGPTPLMYKMIGKTYLVDQNNGGTVRIKGYVFDKRDIELVNEKRKETLLFDPNNITN